jgi:hypothetical protein
MPAQRQTPPALLQQCRQWPLPTVRCWSCSVWLGQRRACTCVLVSTAEIDHDMTHQQLHDEQTKTVTRVHELNCGTSSWAVMLHSPAAMYTHSRTELTVKLARLAGTCRASPMCWIVADHPFNDLAVSAKQTTHCRGGY